MTTMNLDPYATLGIPRSASRADAARAHRRLAKEHHPDLNPGRQAVERMRRINAAWRILSDPARRARYDAEHDTRSAAGHWAGSPRSGPRPGAGPAYGSGSGYGRQHAYGPREYSAGWAPWPEERRAAAMGARRPPRAEPLEPSFGDRPVVVAAVCIGLGLLYFIGAWLGSISP